MSVVRLPRRAARRALPAPRALVVIVGVGAPGAALAQPRPGLGAPMPTLQEVVAAEGLEQCYLIDGESVRWVNGLRCRGYRLALGAEWEMAARAGGEGPYAGGTTVGRVAWTEAHSGDRTHPVGQRAPNAYGLYDLSGNVWEWGWDRAEADPGGPCLSRGSSGDSTADEARV